MSKVAAHSGKTTSTQMEAQRHGSFFALPPELRSWVYREALVSGTILVRSDDENIPPEPALLQICRRVRHETLGIFYQENWFLFVIEHDRADNYIRWCNGVEHRISANTAFDFRFADQVNFLRWVTARYSRICGVPDMDDDEEKTRSTRGLAVDKFRDSGMGRSEALAHMTAMMQVDPLRRIDFWSAITDGVFESLELDGSDLEISSSNEGSPTSSSSRISMDYDKSDLEGSFGTDDEDEDEDGEDLSSDESSEESGESDDGSECSQDGEESDEGDDSGEDGIVY
ncbi:hypothetical protein LTR78_006348 [Recurvomyces mirabilis]|uniref:Uncharacterized protein n=1 Tax=Recurvomyces mirabilis TaxID=574656 RepID=A0AAE1C0C8_9PEZI|nr:hypothetical protein LTR78_006348 [Recurvomyces mirabilis]KAK5152236.1 hypothetical protein LTS14_008612 [Recurvomyces mirabilis]